RYDDGRPARAIGDHPCGIHELHRVVLCSRCAAEWSMTTRASLRAGARECRVIFWQMVSVALVGSVRVKGVNFKTLLSTLARIHGQQSVDATLKELPAEVEEALRLGAVVASGWYPIDWYRALHV